jgi:hypothetical protein
MYFVRTLMFYFNTNVIQHHIGEYDQQAASTNTVYNMQQRAQRLDCKMLSIVGCVCCAGERIGHVASEICRSVL